MASRAFELRNHHHKTFAFSRCGKCGFETEVPRPRMQLGKSENEGRLIVRKLEAIGCFIDTKRPENDRCAQCATPQQRLQQKFRVIDRSAPRQPSPAELLFKTPPPKPRPSRSAILELVAQAEAQLAEIRKLLTTP